MKTVVLCLVVLTTALASARKKDQIFPLTVKVLAADQIKTTKPPDPAPTNIQVCAGEDMGCTNGSQEDSGAAMVKGLQALRAPDTNNAMLVEINGAQVVLTCTKSGGVLSRHLSSCQILLPGEYHARDAGDGHIEVQASNGKVIRYEISGAQ